MPNYCNNNIRITGDSSTISAIHAVMMGAGYARAADDDADLGQPMNLVPMPTLLWGTRSPAPTGVLTAEDLPPELAGEATERIQEHADAVERAERAKRQTGFADWYTWSVAHWGTKWSMEVSKYLKYDNEILISGVTAWSPPLALYSNISRLYPVTIHAEYVEEGMDFIGAGIYRDSEELALSEGSISDNMPDDFDWDGDDAWEIAEDVKEELFAQHVETARTKAGFCV
jgi:hypothetical protein